MALYLPPRPPVKAIIKAGPVGSGAGVLMSEFSLNTLLGKKTPQEKMRQALKLGVQVPWIFAAESTISGNASTADWHLEDDKEVTVDDDYTGPMAQDARNLLENPQAQLTVGEHLTRRQLWEITFREIGLCGNSFWFKDARNSYGIPTSILHIRPDRMTPVDDDAGNLIGWLLDRDPAHGLMGTKIDVDEVIHFVLNVPDEGHFGTGLVESAMLTASISQALNQHMASVLSAGGRLSGFLMPKEGEMGDTPYAQLVADFRNIVEQPDAAKRLQVVRAPVEFISTTMSPSELHIADLLNNYRDQLLALWRTPLSQVGGSNPAGLNSGDTRKYDEAALWQNAIHPRIVAFSESVQMHLLDLYDAAGASLELEIDEPEFDDDSPRYDLLAKSLNTALRNSERRELIGLDPFGPNVMGESGQPLDDEVWLPITLAMAFSASENAQNAPTPTESALGRGEGDGPVSDDNAAAGNAAGETAGPGGVTKAKLSDRQGALHTGLTKLRSQIDRTHTPKLKVSVAAVLEAQRTEIAGRIRKHATAVTKTPKDTTTWWDGAKWDKSLSRALTGRLRSTAETVNEHIVGILPPAEAAKAAPVSAVDRVLAKGAARVTKINETTRDKIREALVRAVDQGMTANDAADAIDAGVAIGGLDMGSLFDEYRSEMIARTELMDAYNGAAIASYADAGLTEVQAIDGNGDPECADRDGQTFSTDEADAIEDHPNGTLDWVPVISDEPAKAKVQPVNPADLMTAAQLHAQQANAMLEHVSGMQLAQAAIDSLSAHNDQHEADRAAMTHAILNQPPAIHHVEAPIVQVQAAEAPSVTVNAPPPDFSPVLDALSAQTEALRPRQVVKTVQRDAAQRISSVVETPVDPEPDNDPDDA